MNRKVYILQSVQTLRALAVIIVMLLTSATAWADDSGSCGDGVTYTFVESTHTLTISKTGDGTGAMGDSFPLPWFNYCNDIQTVIIESGVTSIGNQAFMGCKSLSSITIPASVTNIGDTPFILCTGLSSIYVDDANTQFKLSDDGVLFSKDDKKLILYPAGKTATSYTIPDGVTSIESGAFYGCENLSSVTIPASVTSIGVAAFGICKSLSSIIIPFNVTSIGNSAFNGCSNLKEVYVLRHYDLNNNINITTLVFDVFKDTH